MIDILQYSIGDIYKISPKEEVYKNDPELFKRVDSLAGAIDSYSYTLVDKNQRPIAVIGMSLLWPGVADVWGVISEDVRKCSLSFHKRVKHSLDYHAECLNIKRYQVFVRVGYKEGRKWAETLGFRVEGALDYFGPEGDAYYIMGRIN
jgi:hypothetical protein